MRVVTVGLLLAILVRSAAADPAQALAHARRHFADLDFELVLADTDAIAADRAATAADRAAALFVRGSALVVLDRDADAAAAFDALLALEPAYRPASDTPPRIRASFESARAGRLVHLEEELATREGAQLRAVAIDVDGPTSARGGLPLHLHLRVTDPHRMIDRFVLGYRRDRDHDYASIAVPSAPTVDLVVPGAWLASDRDYRLAWYVEGLHTTGARVRRIGDATDPRWIAISAGQVPRPPGVTSHWWFWAGVATLAASAVAVPVLIERSRDVGPQQVVIR
jgi:hypothetical protein